MLKLDDLDMEFYKNGVEELTVHEKIITIQKNINIVISYVKHKPIKQIINIIHVHENIIYFFNKTILV